MAVLVSSSSFRGGAVVEVVGVVGLEDGVGLVDVTDEAVPTDVEFRKACFHGLTQEAPHFASYYEMLEATFSP